MNLKTGLLLAPLYLVPLGLMFALTAELGSDPFFRHHLSDSAYYLDWAEKVAGGEGFGPYPYFVNPLYLFFLAALKKAGLSTDLGIRTVQIVLGALTYPLVFVVARRLSSWPPALAAWFLALLYGPLLQSATAFSTAWLEPLLALLVLLALAPPASAPRLIGAGILTGLAVLNRPNLVVFAALAPLAIYLSTPKAERGRKLTPHLAAFALAAALAVLPVTVRNYVAGGDLVLVTSHGGINFYIGNSPQAGGTFYAPEGFHEDPMSINRRDSIAIAEERLGRPLRPSEASGYWFSQGVEFLVGQPARALRLYLRKGLFLLHSYEIPLNSNYGFFRDRSRILTAAFLPFGALVVFGAAGLWQVRSRWREFSPYLLLLFVYGAGIMAFFVSSRYRLALAPLLAIPAGGALYRTAIAFGTPGARPWRPLLAAAAAVALLGYPYPPVADLAGDSHASSYESLGIFYFERNDLAKAEASLREAIAVRPAIRSPHWYLARILERRGDFTGAAREWKMAADLYGSQSSWGREAGRNYQRLLRQGYGRP